MVPFGEQESRRILPRGRTRLKEGVTFSQTEDAPDDEAQLIIDRFRGENLSGGGTMFIPEPLTVDIVGREGKDISITPREGKPITLTYEPTIEIQAGRIIKDKEFERYFPLLNKVATFIDRLAPSSVGWGRQLIVTSVFTLPFLGAAVSDFALISPPIKVYDFLTKHWQKEKYAVEQELTKKRGDK